MTDIQRLDWQKYQGSKWQAEYETPGYYDVVTSQAGGVFSFSVLKKAFEHPIQKSFEFDLYPDYYEKAEAFGIFEGEELIAILEIANESWNNRLRITELWVKETHRRRGLGGRLMEYAKTTAVQKGRRALVLETQSCNLPAISLYQKHGFSFIGLDLLGYTNTDAEMKEVRLEMGMTLPMRKE